jgi:GNAT superfamily N-acetyltransferase
MGNRLLSISALVSDIRCLARRDGLRGMLRDVSRALAETVRADGDLLVLAKRLDDVASIGFGGGLALEEIGPQTLPALSHLNRRECRRRADARFAAYVEQGYRGFVARSGGEVVGYYWWLDRHIDPRHEQLEALGIELADGHVYGFDFFLAEAHRGDGNAHQFLEHVETALRGLGYAVLWGYARSENRAARWLYGLRGYEVVRSLHLAPGRMR